tara:strand:+ start:2693 stop:3091 length:399 start_codon:yes stop_codon:yes gene_type:complete
MAQSRRVSKFASLIRREISQLLISDIRDERIQSAMISITEVEVSGDLQHCKVFVSLYGKSIPTNEVMDGLNSASGFVKGELARRLHMRRAPEVIFQLDRALEKGSSVITLLTQLEEDRNKISSFGKDALDEQ